MSPNAPPYLATNPMANLSLPYALAAGVQPAGHHNPLRVLGADLVGEILALVGTRRLDHGLWVVVLLLEDLRKGDRVGFLRPQDDDIGVGMDDLQSERRPVSRLSPGHLVGGGGDAAGFEQAFGLVDLGLREWIVLCRIGGRLRPLVAR